MTSDETKQVYRILVVDDNDSIHDDFRKILGTPSKTGDALQEMESALFGSRIEASPLAPFEIDCAGQGREGLEKVVQAHSEGRPYALAFVDVRMPPGWDGVETIGRLWKEDPDLQVVLCTAYSDYSWREIRNVLGDSDSLLILKKPFDNVEVLQLAHALTRKWELNREVRIHVDNLDDLVRRRTEEKEQTRSLLEAALEHSPAGIIITDAGCTKSLWVNSAAMEICGFVSTGTNGMDGNNLCAGWTALQPDGTPYPRGELPGLEAIRKNESVREKEFILGGIQGKKKWISSNAAPILGADGSKLAGIVILLDITQRKDSEKEREKLQVQLNQVQKMDSIGLLAGGIAHDFNNMLGIILGHAELALQKTDPSQRIHKSLGAIRKAARTSARLTQQLLAFARKQIISPKSLNLSSRVSATLGMLCRLVGEGITIHWEPDPDVWPIRIDPSQIDQILINLCINARDAIDQFGAITINVGNTRLKQSDTESRPWFRPGDYAVLTVTDTGRGIKEKHLGRIFEPFFTTKEIGTGTGLGLATVYGIVKQNNGFIHADSTPGKGSSFTIYLPRFIGKGKAPVPPAKRESGRGERVLIVEDQKQLLDLTQMLLEELGYTVLTAEGPHEAVRVAESNAGRIDLLMTDVIMPEMNGSDLSKLLLGKYPDLKCLFMSGYANNIISRHGVLAEGVHFLKKPFSTRELSVKVRETLDDENATIPGAVSAESIR